MWMPQAKYVCDVPNAARRIMPFAGLRQMAGTVDDHSTFRHCGSCTSTFECCMHTMFVTARLISHAHCTCHDPFDIVGRHGPWLASIDLLHGLLLDILEGEHDELQERLGTAVGGICHRSGPVMVFVQTHLERLEQHPVVIAAWAPPVKRTILNALAVNTTYIASAQT